MLKTCSRCGAGASPEARFCISCGAELDAEREPLECSQCGAALDPDTKYCTACGARRPSAVEGRAAQRTNTARSADPHERSTERLVGDVDYSTREAAQLCSTCGATLEAHTTFCPACGASQDPYFSDDAAAFAPTADEEFISSVHASAGRGSRSRSRLAIWLGVVAVAAIAGGVAAVLALSPASRKTVVVHSGGGGGGSSGAAPPTSTYTSSGYTAQYPSGWTIAEDDTNQGSYDETKFVSPDGNETLLIDRTPGDNTDPLTSAEQVESQTQSSSGYQRLGMDPTTINGASAEEWTFALGSERRVDFFFNQGGDGYAVLGHGSDFNQALSDARRLANSIQPR